ncbi:dioxygenase family protein [Vibrio mangrovi]|uniref:Class III extradiol ring-cleavage dioxygenase n=1 Tax=Vibrio mangrovi TaxID=474394 RepID=A0A1Y6IVQ7_9VIBR|nr:class III extradiol ring-cleavage dioxygenase [Vibrio mangrovi]MDW6004945.1 class III extradiol ring-cleavage dioxygenase [Vibrio mangrovi]SMS01708.1 LigB family dioxygenase [Vibrio mangrovi]
MNNVMMPTLFVSHGSPMMAVEESSTTRFLEQMGQTIPKPKAIIVFSAHFDIAGPVVITSGQTLGTIHDFYGFPKPLYDIEYPAQGAPDLARQAGELLQKHGFPVALDHTQGLDHGAWVPMLYMFPDRDIPIISISINSQAGAQRHYELGKALRSLRQEGVLFVGSGGISHNLRAVFTEASNPESIRKMHAFTDWMAEKVEHRDVTAINDYIQVAPYALYNHPTPDHFLPLPCILGTSDESEHGQVLHRSVDMGLLALDAYGFGFAA